MDDPSVLAPGLPAPVDDGAARRLAGMPVPSIALPASDGSVVRLSDAGPNGCTILYAYPRIGRPGEAPWCPTGT